MILLAIISAGALGLGLLLILAAANTPSDSADTAFIGLILAGGGVLGLIVDGIIALVRWLA